MSTIRLPRPSLQLTLPGAGVKVLLPLPPSSRREAAACDCDHNDYELSRHARQYAYDCTELEALNHVECRIQSKVSH